VVARSRRIAMTYGVPGHADQFGAELVEKWNDTVHAAYEDLRPSLGSRFFALDPGALTSPGTAPVKWFGDPAEPTFCMGPETAQQLSDWGVRGRHVLHNEYCEYRVVERTDTEGRRRPKRVQVTTELREYWVCVAMHDPDALRVLADDVLGFEPAWEDLYGVGDPFGLDAEQRKRAFSTLVAGHGNDTELAQEGIPAQPVGRLNTDNALFMTHPINGLDDLLYIVLFGAKPYARGDAGDPQPATREQIFREFGVEQLACRHADPAAAMGAHGAAFDGRTVAFADPLGMYISSFSADVFVFQDNPVPEAWIRWGRGREKGLYQRLEFGPDDDDPAFLDDISVAVGASEAPLRGGFQLLQQLEVGPRVIVGEPSQVADEEYVFLSASDAQIPCHEASICTDIEVLKEEFDNEQRLVRVAPRIMGRRDR
jgi:hypothetical protein